MGRGSEERERLFNLYAANLTALAPEWRDAFVCPLCHSVHGRDSLLGDIPELTLEHCVPKSLGGRLLTLTCRKCNNSHGEKIDSHLRKKIVAEDAFEGIGGSIDGFTSVESHTYRCNFRFSNGERKGIAVRPIEKASNPGEKAAAFRVMKEAKRSTGEYKGTFTFRPGYNERLWKLSLLKSAFLLMFRQFGYSYIFHHGPEFVSRQIGEHAGEVLTAAVPSAFRSDFDTSAYSTFIVTSPKELRCFLVPVRVSTDHRTQTKLVVLPGFDEEATAIYTRWSEHSCDGEVDKVMATGFATNSRWLTTPDTDGAMQLWDKTFGLPIRSVRWKLGVKYDDEPR